MLRTMMGWATDHPFKAAGAVAAALALVMAAALALGSADGRLPDPATVGQPSASPSATGVPSAGAATPAPGNAGRVSSSTGTDWGASLPRLGASPFARTSDPQVFAASVQAATGYDYSEFQPVDATEEQQRIVDEWLAGMTGEDGPLGGQTHRALREAVDQSIDPEALAYRVAARQTDTIDVLAVQPTDNGALRAAAGNDVYLKVISNRDTLYALTTMATVTSQFSAVADVSGYTRTQTTAVSMIVRCDPAVNEGNCELVGIIGGGSQ